MMKIPLIGDRVERRIAGVLKCAPFTTQTSSRSSSNGTTAPRAASASTFTRSEYSSKRPSARAYRPQSSSLRRPKGNGLDASPGRQIPLCGRWLGRSPIYE
jgi:hypothetical protein